MDSMKVAVMGGGNSSHTIAADLSLKGLTVNMFEMERFAGNMRGVFETRQIEMSGVAGNDMARLMRRLLQKPAVFRLPRD